MLSATIESVESVLGTCPGLQTLEQELIRQLAGISRIIEVASDAVLCREGSRPDALHYLLDGQVALTQSAAGGSSAVIDVVHPISSLALAGVVADQPHMMTAQAIKPSRLLEISAGPLRRMISIHSRLAVSMLQGLSVDVEAATRQVLDLKMRSSAQRLGCYLLSLVIGPANGPIAFSLPYQKRLLAARLGCRYENLSRAFAVLRDYGVETHGSRVILHDIRRLQDFSVPDAPVTAQPVRTAAEAFSRAFEF